jgi:hypothetical protein
MRAVRNALHKIPKKQCELGAWDEDIVVQGLITMREFILGLADQNEAAW